MVENILFFPPFLIPLLYLSDSCNGTTPQGALPGLESSYIHVYSTPRKSSHLFLQAATSSTLPTTYNTYNLLLDKQLLPSPLAVDTKLDSPHSSSQRKLTGSGPSVPLVSHALKFFYNFPLFKGHSGLNADRIFISNIVSRMVKV